MTFDGTFAGQHVIVLKDDGCNKIVISMEFVKRNRSYLKVKKMRSTISHSDKDQIETSSEIVLDAKVQIGDHFYRSNWVVANGRYDLLLGTPWHYTNEPTTNYENGRVTIGDVILMRRSPNHSRIEITNIRVKKFRSLIRKK